MVTFDNLLDKYRRLSYSQSNKGSRFERLMQSYLQTELLYATRLKRVWLWEDFFAKRDLGGHDTGIDLVAETIEGDFWAIQCKCYQADTPIDKPAVDSFLSTSSRTFPNGELQTVSFSHRLWISTTNKWGSNAEESIKNQSPPVSRINLYDLQQSSVDWEKLESGILGEEARAARKSIRPHQREAIEKVHVHYATSDRGKLIMACGTGKTFTSLKIAERETCGRGTILFLVPSIALLGQTLREWSAEADVPINAICICSDPEVSKKKSKNEDSDAYSVVDLALPASTDPHEILRRFQSAEPSKERGMTVVFSTYQSIEVIAKAQGELLKNGFSEFDLIICDEAHRTTGVKLASEEESSFIRVHNNDFIRGKKRLYMTATPRLYSEDSKSRAAEAEAILCSMDDETIYGTEMYRIGFGESVDKKLLTDYKVLILTLNDHDVPPAVQNMIADQGSEITSDDASKLIGCINALSKQILGDNGSVKATDPLPMRRAVAFCRNIKVSKKITDMFNATTGVYINSLPQEKRESMVSTASAHIDGTMSAPVREEKMSWLKAEPLLGECRVLTNVRCLSEGVDVPSLDAVMFLSARNSQVDVVQSVGRVMRLAEGKQYGYIIIPVIIPSDVEAESALNDNEHYKVVWTVLNALRAHDDRFDAIVNKIELNRSRPSQILIATSDTTFDESGNPVSRSESGANVESNRQLVLQFEQLQNIVFARMVQNVGNRRYWEQWARSVAEIAERQVERIKFLVRDVEHKARFESFLYGLQRNINPSISDSEAIEMLSQHIITRPVFDALFEGYSFVNHNPISISMQGMLDLLESGSFDKDTEVLRKFYDSVKLRASGIDNAEGRQRIIIELYDKFFKTAFPRMVERLGIVYTPVEVVDFIIHSVDVVLRQEFNCCLSDERVNILDPFTGTGTFITRLIQSGLIRGADMERKYRNELFANEIVLLAYYITAVNIENAYHESVALSGSVYVPFDGICLTDPFQLGELDDRTDFHSEMFPCNSERVECQGAPTFTVIMGNPPYAIGRKSANDDAQNQEYSKLNARIESTCVASSVAGLNKSLYDVYIKVFSRFCLDQSERASTVSECCIPMFCGDRVLY
jgi:predicted helicase